MEKEQPKRNHTLSIENRVKGSVTGVEKVVSSNETQLSLETSGGGLILSGTGLKINKFDVESGLMTFEGSITAVKYSGAKVSLIKKIFS